MEFLPLEKDGHKVYAGLGLRSAAKFIDFVIFIPFMVAFYYLTKLPFKGAIYAGVLSTLIFSLYTVYFHYRFGATLGKMAAGIKITLPNGFPIGIRQALLRSAVELGFAVLLVIAQIIALSKLDPEQYSAATWRGQTTYLAPFYPAWYRIAQRGNDLWFWSELIVLLLNKRRRALHDFMAGTVVIQQKFARKSNR